MNRYPSQLTDTTETHAHTTQKHSHPTHKLLFINGNQRTDAVLASETEALKNRITLCYTHHTTLDVCVPFSCDFLRNRKSSPSSSENDDICLKFVCTATAVAAVTTTDRCWYLRGCCCCCFCLSLRFSKELTSMTEQKQESHIKCTKNGREMQYKRSARPKNHTQQLSSE